MIELVPILKRTHRGDMLCDHFKLKVFFLIDASVNRLTRAYSVFLIYFWNTNREHNMLGLD